jgi:hypothetical protein
VQNKSKTMDKSCDAVVASIVNIWFNKIYLIV